jgi:hypothetical protein
VKNSKSFGRLWMIGWGVLTYHSSFVESTDKLCKLSSILIICYFWEHVISTGSAGLNAVIMGENCVIVNLPHIR